MSPRNLRVARRLRGGKSGRAAPTGRWFSEPATDKARRWDLAALPAFGECVSGFAALSPDGEVGAAGSRDGTVRVGRLSGEPYLLVGHVGPVGNVAISPDLRWAAARRVS